MKRHEHTQCALDPLSKLRAWTLHEDGTRTFDVPYQPAGSNSRTIGTFEAGHVREDTVDPSHGRRS